mgnify:CR=1 FL=1
MEGKVKNLCAPIPEGLHARVREEQEASGQTLGQYMTWLIQTFYHNQKEETSVKVSTGSAQIKKSVRKQPCQPRSFQGKGQNGRIYQAELSTVSP